MTVIPQECNIGVRVQEKWTICNKPTVKDLGGIHLVEVDGATQSASRLCGEHEHATVVRRLSVSAPETGNRTPAVKRGRHAQRRVVPDDVAEIEGALASFEPGGP